MAFVELACGEQDVVVTSCVHGCVCLSEFVQTRTLVFMYGFQKFATIVLLNPLPDDKI